MRLRIDIMRSSALGVLALSLGTIAATQAVAQEAPQTPEKTAAADTAEVVVTGSRIVRPDLASSSPVSVISAKDIQLRQPATAEELLRDMPALRPNIGPGVNNGGDGSATLELRGIGANRTLVLLDGRRLVPFGLDGLTDTNNIPVALIERVDTLTGGASSTYGADAVAGVVNFITKRDFKGLTATANYRFSEKGDATRFKADVVVGASFDDDRGNVVLSVGYTKADPLLTTARSIGAYPISSVTGQFSGATAAQVTIFGAPSNAKLGIPASSFGAVVNPTTGLLQPATASDTFNSNIGTYFQTPLDRINVYASGRYEISDGIEFYSTAMFNRNKVRLQLASSGTFGNTYQLALNNPYLPAGILGQLCSASGISATDCATAAAVQGGPGTAGYREIPVVAQRRITEMGARGNPIESQMFQVMGGFRGSIIDSLRYDVSAQYGETTQNQTREHWGSFSKVQQALRAYKDKNGNFVCADPSNGCVPLNLFGPNGSITPQQVAFIDLSALINRKVQQTVITGTITGDLFTVPLADHKIGFAIGGEYRKISARSMPDSASQIQGEVLGTGARTPPDFGQYSVKEVYGEINAPLIEDKPFFYRLGVEAGIRYSDYTTTGGSTTWKVGGTWEPYQGFKFRGTYSVAVRSPNIQELYQSPVQSLGNLTIDPCVGNVTGGLAALCVATGAPASTIGQIPSPTSNQINNTTSGNRNLNVERARTYTFGTALTPSFLPGFSLTVDYFHIKIRDAITQPAQADILNGCYSAALNPGFSYNAFCQLIKRNPLTGSLNGAGETPGVILTYSNLGVIETAGWDFGVNQRLRMDDLGVNVPGNLTFSMNGTLLNYYRFQATPNSINRNCTAYYSSGGCTNPRAKWRWVGRLGYGTENFDVSLLWTHVGSVSLEPGVTGIRPEFSRIPAYNYFDLATRVSPTENLELSLTVNNLFNKQPPLVGNGVGGTTFNGGNTFPTIYDVIGRSFTVGARLKF
ncbi:MULTISPECIES: TonB-dependent receptor plug domain-containing protein [Sphingomonas]|uniref:TonB-dependent receptor n=1 Tax=Sphingomonas lycopersici TaxID=2951807 RepID=A0AA42CQ74_9SPHN|nr:MULTISPECIES: TonB-dependent receptor [Sphingomonas]MCW6529475.1 TonB-dependent receptor [Sphingomonas lycopersici]MCW6534602.1 TonB-dependent receptor [Sphingomonas lycopersici]